MMNFISLLDQQARTRPEKLALRADGLGWSYAALAEAHGLSPAQLALKFVYSRWFVASTIIGATSLAQLEENLNAWDAPWSEALEQAVADIRLRWFNPAP